MLLYELFEARRNPGQNIANLKQLGHAAAVDYLNELAANGEDLKWLGVSMTELPKLGVNVKSTYNTPVGIYFYPAEYYLKKKKTGKQLEFADDKPYIQIFEFTNNPVDIDSLSSTAYAHDLRKLYKSADTIAQLLGTDEDTVTKMLSKAVLDARAEANVNSYGGQLWYVIYTLSSFVIGGHRGTQATRSAVVWNKLLRLLDFDVIVDRGGEGIIHQNEKYQGVVVDPRMIKMRNTIRNDNAESDSVYSDLANVAAGNMYVENVIDSIRDHNLKYSEKNRKFCKTVIDKCLESLRANPRLYTRLNKDGIDRLLTLNNNAKVAQEMTVELYAQKFPRLQSELNTMIDGWESLKNDPDNSDRSKLSQKRLIVEQYKVDQARKVVQDLTQFKSNTKAAEMIKFLTDAIALLA